MSPCVTTPYFSVKSAAAAGAARHGASSRAAVANVVVAENPRNDIVTSPVDPHRSWGRSLMSRKPRAGRLLVRQLSGGSHRVSIALARAAVRQRPPRAHVRAEIVDPPVVRAHP